MSDDYINKIISINLETLIKKENVIGLASSTKFKDGINTGEKCIVVFVSKKVSENNLSPSNIIPNKLENVKTDVIAVDTIKPQIHKNLFSLSSLTLSEWEQL